MINRKGIRAAARKWAIKPGLKGRIQMKAKKEQKTKK
jgi:hypothetical protein